MTRQEIEQAFIARRTLNYRPVLWTCLAHLATKKLVQRDQLVDDLWPNPDESPLAVYETVSAYMSLIRAKLRPYGINPKSVYGEGYYITEAEQANLINLIKDLEEGGK